MSDFQWTDELIFEFVNFYDEQCKKKPTWTSEALQQFKEEHTKPKVEWEIVAYDYMGQVVSATNSLIKLYDCPIYSVRRLSDGEVFSIGDEVEYRPGDGKDNWCGSGKITEIFKSRMYPENLVFSIEDGGERNAEKYIFNIRKKVTKPIPLFKTEDGVDIFKGGSCWIVDDKHKSPYAWENVIKCGMREGERYFSTRNAADEHLFMNKPLLSLNDVIKCGGKWLSDDQLKNLAKEKLSK